MEIAMLILPLKKTQREKKINGFQIEKNKTDREKNNVFQQP